MKITPADCRLYGIMDMGYVRPEDLEKATTALLDGGVRILQLRAKGVELDAVRGLAQRMQPLCRRAGAIFVLNDYPELAAELGADAVHVGQDAGPLAEVRRLVGPQMIIGRSTHSPEQALAAHAEDNELVTGNIKRLRAEGRVDNLAHCESRPPIVEIEAIAKILRFSEEAGCPVELVHVSTCGAMELAKREKQKGRRILVETCPHYLLLDESYVEKYGAYAKCNPALRKKEEVEGLWNYITDGTIDFIGSDHSPYLVSEKEKGKDDIFTAPAGFPGIDLRMPLILTEAKKGRLTMERAVELLCVNPAKLFNIFPQKGTISAGADADLAIVDMNKERVFHAKDSYSQAKEIMKVFEGWQLGCTIDYTVVRGRVVMENGVVDESAAGWGEFVKPALKK